MQRFRPYSQNDGLIERHPIHSTSQVHRKSALLKNRTVDALEQIIAREKPEALLPTVGGQTALNLAVELAEAGVAGGGAMSCANSTP